MKQAAVLVCVIATAVAVTGCSSPRRDGGWLGDDPAWYGSQSTQGGGSAEGSVFERSDPADVDLSETIQLDQLILVAFARNPSLKAARDRYRGALAAYGEAVALPDPIFQWTTRPEPIETRTGPQTDVYALSQGIPWPGKLILKGEIAVDTARMARERFLAATRDLMAELKEAYFELAYLDKAIGIVRQTQDLAQHLATRTRSGVAENAEVKPDQVTLMDALKAEAQLSQLSYDLATLMETRAAEEARVNRILNRPPAARVGTPEGLKFRELRATRDELYELTIHNRQELRLALIRLQRAGKMRDLADLSWAPDFFIGGSLLETGSPINPGTPGGGDDAWGISFGITLPIWTGKNNSRVAQAEYERRAAIRERQDALNRSMEDVTRLYYRLSNARRLVVLYRDQLVPQARSAMGIAEQWQQVGRDDIGRVLEAQGVWLNFNLALARAVADYQQTLARVERAVGLPLGEFVGAPQPDSGEAEEKR